MGSTSTAGGASDSRLPLVSLTCAQAIRVAILPTIAGLAKHQSSLQVRQLGEIRGTDAPFAGSLPEPPEAQLEALAWLPRAVLVEMRLVQSLAVRLDHMNSSAKDTTNPADPRYEPMGLEEAGRVMWLRNNYRPLGDLPPTSLPLWKSRQAKNSIVFTQALFTPIPFSRSSCRTFSTSGSADRRMASTRCASSS